MPRSGTSARRACCAALAASRPAADPSGQKIASVEVDREVADEGERSDHDRCPATCRGRGRRRGRPSRAAHRRRRGSASGPDQNATTVSRPRIESVSAVAPAASRCSPRGTTQPKTTAAATAMIAQTTRNSLRALLVAASPGADRCEHRRECDRRRSRPGRRPVPRPCCSCRHSFCRGLEQCRSATRRCRRRRGVIRRHPRRRSAGGS